MKKGTPLWKALLLEHRIPYRYHEFFKKKFGFIYLFFETGSFSKNMNTKKYWNNRLRDYGNFWRNGHYKHLVDFFPKNKKFSLLDMGCAIGDGCVFLNKIFPKAEIEGADLSKIGINKAKKKNEKINFFVLNILKEKIPKKYDYILLIETLEHFDNPFIVVDKCLKNVKKSLIISVPYTKNIKNPNIDYGSEHRYLFNECTFKDYNAKILRITKVKGTKEPCLFLEIKNRR